MNILYTGTNPLKYKSRGTIIHLPMIEIKEAVVPKKRIQSLKRSMDSYAIILLTSRFGVQYFFRFLKKEEFSFKKIKNKDFAVIGKDTAASLRKLGIRPKVTASEETSGGLLNALREHFDLKSKKILFPRSSLPNPFLKKELKNLGSHVDEFKIYRNLKPRRQTLPQKGIDVVLFTSPSTVRNFLLNYGRIPGTWKILCKGPVTKEYLQKKGYHCCVNHVTF